MLLEFTLGAVLMVALASMGVLASRTVTSEFQTEFDSSQLESVASKAGADVVQHLRSADLNAVFPVAIPGTISPWIDYQTVVMPGATKPAPPERLTFESDPGDRNDGIDNDGDGLVDEGRLVWIENPGLANERRQVLANWVPEYFPGEIPGNLQDDNGNGLVDEPGVCFEFQEGRVLLHLSLVRPGSAEGSTSASVTRTIALRNTY